MAAGEEWEPFVARCVAEGLAGVECLSGIPGSIGATPIQNVGAYGQEVAETIVSVRVLERETGEVRDARAGRVRLRLPLERVQARPRRWVVLAVTFALERRELSGPLRYAELARTLDVRPGEGAPLADVREAVLGLRRGKGMVIDPADPDSVSAGSFFTNPILGPDDVLRPRAAGGAPAALPGARRARQDLGGVADRARGLPARLRQSDGSRSRPSTRSRWSTAAAARPPS